MSNNHESEQSNKLPAFVNEHAGTAPEVIKILADHPSISLHILSASEMESAIKQSVANNHRRIIVSGGDGTLALAAGLTIGSQTELAIIPGGTLNHFAKRLLIPTDIRLALELAIHGQASSTHVAFVNDYLFLNTSSVGAYVTFVRTREYLERKMQYLMASLLAGIRRLYHFRHANIMLDKQKIKTPLLFVGVGERDLQIPAMGQIKTGGRDGLHLIVVRCSNSLSAIKLAFSAMLMGVDPLSKAKMIETQMMEQFNVTLRSRKKWLTVAVDGELIKLKPPLHYRFQRDSLNVVIPASDEVL